MKKQITSHERPMNFARYVHKHVRRLHTRLTGPLQGKLCVCACTGSWIQGAEGRGGLRGVWCCPTQRQPWNSPSHNETCHSVYEIMSNWKHCSHCAPVTASIVHTALLPPPRFFPLTRRDCSSPLWQPYPPLQTSPSLPSLPLCVSPSPSSHRIVIISLLICFLFRFSFHSPADLLCWLYLGSSLGSHVRAQVCVCVFRGGGVGGRGGAGVSFTKS